jgi:glutamine amidotransferase
VDYGVCNIEPLARTLKKSGVKVSVMSIYSVSKFEKFDILILPGIGSFDFAKQQLDSSGFTSLILDYYEEGGRILGICLGMQLLGLGSEEGVLPGLGIVRATAKGILQSQHNAFQVNNGWNGLEIRPQFEGVEKDWSNISNRKFYFSHSYGFKNDEVMHFHPTFEIGTIEKSNVVATFLGERVAGAQFHPERSHNHGLVFLDFLWKKWGNS